MSMLSLKVSKLFSNPSTTFTKGADRFFKISNIECIKMFLQFLQNYSDFL